MLAHEADAFAKPEARHLAAGEPSARALLGYVLRVGDVPDHVGLDSGNDDVLPIRAWTRPDVEVNASQHALEAAFRGEPVAQGHGQEEERSPHGNPRRPAKPGPPSVSGRRPPDE